MDFLSYPGLFSNPNDIGTYNRYIFRSFCCLHGLKANENSVEIRVLLNHAQKV